AFQEAYNFPGCLIETVVESIRFLPIIQFSPCDVQQGSKTYLITLTQRFRKSTTSSDQERTQQAKHRFISLREYFHNSLRQCFYFFTPTFVGFWVSSRT